MSVLPYCFAQANPAGPLAAPELTPAPRQLLDKGTTIVIAAIVIVAAVAFFWAFFLRRRPKSSRRTIVLDRNRSGSSQAYGSSGRRRRRKRRDTHPENMPRNPTLSETGGLPPPRPEEAGPPAPSGSPQSS